MNSTGWMLAIVVIVLLLVLSTLSSIKREIEGVYKLLRSSEPLDTHRDIKAIKDNVVECRESLNSIEENTQPPVVED